MKNNLRFLGLLFIIFFLSNTAFALSWLEYKNKFIAKDGRIIDYYQNHCSHSEGQGYGLLLAVLNNDQNYFDLIWNWTKNNLQLRHRDNLFCWQWGERIKNQWTVIDYNNATDGDLLIAWALVLAWKKWGKVFYKNEAQKIINSIKKYLIIQTHNKLILLPGYYGFIKSDGYLVNPSYVILPAFSIFEEVDSKDYWQSINRQQKELLKTLKIGQWQLCTDWLLLSKKDLTPTISNKGPFFSYDAYRIFLYDSLSDHHIFKDSFYKISLFFKKNGYLPEKIDLNKNFISLKNTIAGIYAIMGLYAKSIGEKELSKNFFKIAEKKIHTEKNNYYSATLYILASTFLTNDK